MPGLVELGDGSGYYATLSVYHSLHCVKRLHYLMYFDHYYPGKTGLEAMLIKQHGGKSDSNIIPENNSLDLADARKYRTLS